MYMPKYKKYINLLIDNVIDFCTTLCNMIASLDLWNELLRKLKGLQHRVRQAINL